MALLTFSQEYAKANTAEVDLFQGLPLGMVYLVLTAWFDRKGFERPRVGAPTARNMIARGKREARRPWNPIVA